MWGMEEVSEAAGMVRAPVLRQWREHRACPACGERGRLRDRLLQLLRGGPDRFVTVGWCAGGKEPTEPVQVATLAGIREAEGRYACAGIAEEHLHITCRNCGRQWLSQVREKQ